jgi:hypothetical protein
MRYAWGYSRGYSRGDARGNLKTHVKKSCSRSVFTATCPRTFFFELEKSEIP